MGVAAGHLTSLLVSTASGGNPVGDCQREAPDELLLFLRNEPNSGEGSVHMPSRSLLQPTGECTAAGPPRVCRARRISGWRGSDVTPAVIEKPTNGPECHVSSVTNQRSATDCAFATLVVELSSCWYLIQTPDIYPMKLKSFCLSGLGHA